MTVLPEYRAQLHAAARARATAPPPHARGWARTVSRLPAVVAALVATGVAVTGVIVLHPRHTANRGDVGAPAAARRQLIEAFGVLRRPPTRADLMAERTPGTGGLLPGYLGFPKSRACGGPNAPVLLCSVTLQRSLLRSVRVRGYRVGIFPASATPSAAPVQPSEGVVMAFRGPGIYYADSGPRLTSVATLRRQGLVVSAYVSGGVNRGAILVPDGVARVTLGSFRLAAPWSPARPVRIAATGAPVSDNVALFQLSGLTEKNLRINPEDRRLSRLSFESSGHACTIDFAIYGLPGAARMTWFDARGDAVRATNIRLLLYVGTRHPAPGSADDPVCAGRKRS